MADSAGYFELASNIADFFTNSSNDDLMIRTQYPTQDILIGTSNGLSTMVITSNAVAINKTIPAYTLDVVGDINFTGGLFSNGTAFVGGGGGGASGFSFNGSNLFTLCNIGIGNSNPNHRFVVDGAGQSTSAAISTGAENASATLFLGTPFAGSLNTYKTGIVAEGINSYSRAKLHFCLDNTIDNNTIYNASVANSRMTITNAGNVGIGTTSPSSLLDVSGSARFLGGITACNSIIHTSNEIGISPNAYNPIFIWDDQKATTTFTGQLSGSATRDTTNGYIQLTSATNSQTGNASWLLNPGNAFHLSFDYFSGGGTGADAMHISFFSTSSNGQDAVGYNIMFDEYNGGTGNDIITTTIGGSNINTWDLGVASYLDNSTWKKIDLQFIRGSFAISIDNGTRLRTFTDSNQRSILWNTNTWFSLCARTGGANNNHRVRNIRLSKLEQGFWSTTTMSNNDIIYPYGNMSVMSNVGIGTSNPAFRLDVAGNARINTALISEMGFGAGVAGFGFSGVANQLSYAIAQDSSGITYVNSSNNRVINFRHGNVDQMTLSNGNLGIGTTSPGYKLDVIGTMRTTSSATFGYDFALFSNNGAWSTTAGRQLYMRYNTNVLSAEGVYIQSTDRSTGVYYNMALECSNLAIHSLGNPLGTSTPNFYVQYGGNVGVGTSNPQTRLHVQAGSVFIGDTANGFSSTVPSAPGGNSAPSVFHRLFFDNGFNGTAGTGTPANKIVLHNNNWTAGFGLESGSVTYHSGLAHTFYTGSTSVSTYGTACMYVGTNVGIGTTSPLYKLDVRGSMSINADNIVLGVDAQSNARLGFLKQHGAFPKIAAAAGSPITFCHLNTGDLGQTISNATGFTDRMIIDSNGNLGIGTTSPSYNLDVVGASRVTGVITRSFTVSLDKTIGGVRNVCTFTNGAGAGILGFDITMFSSANSSTMAKMYKFTRTYAGSSSAWQRCAPFSEASANGDSFELQINVSLGNTSFRVVRAANDASSASSQTVTINITCNYPQNDVVTITDNTGNAQTTDANWSTYSLFSSTNITQTSNNNVGISTISPAYKLDVNGNTRLNNAVIGDLGHGGGFAGFAHSNQVSSSTYAFLQQNDGATYINSSNAKVIFFRHGNVDQMALNAGNLGIGTTSPSQKLHVIGNILASGDITAFSDQRLKSNIKIIPDALTKLHNLNGYTFDVTASQQDTNNTLKVTPQHTGLIAQEVLDVLPEAVHKDKDGYYSLAYGNMVGLLVQAVKELDNKYQKMISDMHQQQQKEINELRVLLTATQTLV